MPDDPDITIAQGARSLIRNGLMQNDLDADHHKILNLDTSNLVLNGPNPFPAQANKWLKSYDNVTQNFAATQPLITEMAGFPVQTGHGGQVLGTDGSVLSWVAQTGGGSGPPPTYVNVKNYGATGNGTTDDFDAIMLAIAAAKTLGFPGTVYFPKGTYKINHNLQEADGSGFSGLSFLGDNPVTTVILAREDQGDAMLRLGSNSSVQRLGFNGNMNAALSGTTITNNRIGIGVFNASNVVIRDCFVSFCSHTGILVLACLGNIYIQNSSVFNCGRIGINVGQSPITFILNNYAAYCHNGPGIQLANTQQCIVRNNLVSACGHISFNPGVLGTGISGITLVDADNTVVEGNVVQQCGLGMLVANSGVRSPLLITYGYSISGNIIYRNYFGGALMSLANGFRFNGNNVVDNGQGGADDATYTLEPGFIVRTAGTGYTVGQVLTVAGGTGTAAKLVVLNIGSGGSLATVYPLTMGNYTVFPPVDANGTVGVTVGVARLIMTTSRILAAGSNYTRGMMLRSTTPGHNGHPAKIIIINVNPSGGVTGYAIADGGGYTSQPAALDFVSDAQADTTAMTEAIGSTPDIPDAVALPETGFRITPMWGKRFSWFNNSQKAFGLGTLGPINSGLMSGNIIDQNLGSGIQLMEIPSSDWSGRAQLLIISSNHVILNTTSIKGWVIGTTTLDCNITTNNMIETNFVYPIDCTVLEDTNTSPFP
jgi:Pectate lyase superfamily protein